MSILPRSGARSRRAASLTDCMSGLAVVMVSEAKDSSETIAGAGGNGASAAIGSGAGAGAETGGIGIGAGAVGRGATGRGMGRGAGPGRKSLIGAAGPAGAILISGAGAATGSAKTGSLLVFFVMSSIAFCKSLSTVGFICPPLNNVYTYIYNSTLFLNAQEIYEFI